MHDSLIEFANVWGAKVISMFNRVGMDAVVTLPEQVMISITRVPV